MESISRHILLGFIFLIQMKVAAGFVAKEVLVPPVPWPRTKVDLEIQLSTITVFSTKCHCSLI